MAAAEHGADANSNRATFQARVNRSRGALGTLQSVRVRALIGTSVSVCVCCNRANTRMLAVLGTTGRMLAGYQVVAVDRLIGPNVGDEIKDTSDS